MLRGPFRRGQITHSDFKRGIKIEPDDIRFSLLTTGIGWEEIQAFIGLKSSSDVEASGLKEEEFEEFFRWVFEKTANSGTRLGDSRNFSKLAKVVSNARALQAIRRGDPLDAAHLLTSGPLETLRSQITEAHGFVKAAQESLAYVNEGVDGTDAERAEVLKKAAQALSASVKEAAASERDHDADA